MRGITFRMVLIHPSLPKSGKLVGKMFANIRELIANEDGFVCVLMDEVGGAYRCWMSACLSNVPYLLTQVVH